MLDGLGPQGSSTLLNQRLLAPEPVSAVGLAPASVELKDRL